MNDRADPMPTPIHPLRWFPEFLQFSQRRLRPQARVLLLSLLVGVVAGGGAIAFFVACQVVTHYSIGMFAGYHPASPGGESSLFAEAAGPISPWLLILIPAVGGLLSGLLVYTFAPEAEGHGTDAAISAYHFHGGQIRGRVPLIKMIASALSLGTGGSGGREGPIAQIGAGFGSFLGKILRLRAAERRVLMAAGMGAGISAIFKAPLAGALFAAEVLYSSPDFESEVVIPAGLASVTAYCTFGLAFGWNSLFALPAHLSEQLTFDNPWHLIPYTLLALFVVLLAMLYTRTFYGLTHLFHRLRIRPHFRPMLGAAATGILAVLLYFLFGRNSQVLATLSFGYGILQTVMTLDPMMEGNISLAAVLMAVALGKILTTGMTIGSGGSGGVFGPSMVIGGCGGGALGIILHHFWPGWAPHPASFAIIGMAGFFAAAAKTPLSTLLIVSEMTGTYQLLLPTMWVCAIAFLLSDEQSIYSSQLKSPALSPAHQGDYIRSVLAGLTVKEFITPLARLPSLHANDTLEDVIRRLSSTSYQVLPVLDETGRLLGMVSLEEIYAASQSPELNSFLLAMDMMRPNVTGLFPDERLDKAVELFAEYNLDALPVIDRETSAVAGIVKRSDISRAYLQHVHGTGAKNV